MMSHHHAASSSHLSAGSAAVRLSSLCLILVGSLLLSAVSVSHHCHNNSKNSTVTVTRISSPYHSPSWDGRIRQGEEEDLKNFTDKDDDFWHDGPWSEDGDDEGRWRWLPRALDRMLDASYDVSINNSSLNLMPPPDGNHTAAPLNSSLLLSNATTAYNFSSTKKKKKKRRKKKNKKKDGQRDGGVVVSNPALQPKVTVVEKLPARKVFGSLSNAKGTPWCHGQPTYWLVGHQKWDETPWCLGSRGEWSQPRTAVLDAFDAMNDDKNSIDRHDCTALDVNRDGLDDIICLTGAGKGKGRGYPELYLTRTDGSLTKIKTGHGLHRYSTMRGRIVIPLRGFFGKSWIFMATKATHRKDGLPNQHRMFENVYSEEDKFPYFRETFGPWIQYFEASCAINSDFNSDGLDDLIVCNKDGRALLVRQTAQDGWKNVPLSKEDGGEHSNFWRNARVSDVTGDGINDLIVVYHGLQSKMRIFKGRRKSPYFDFDKPYHTERLPYAAPDVVVLDINRDAIPDIYIVQVDEDYTKQTRSYCALGRPNELWGDTVQPPADWVPPFDKAHDILLVGTTNHKMPFRRQAMFHSFPGCGYLVERFGDRQTLILAQGNQGHPGHNLLLEW